MCYIIVSDTKNGFGRYAQMGEEASQPKQRENFLHCRTDIQIVLNTTENVISQALKKKKLGQLKNKKTAFIKNMTFWAHIDHQDHNIRFVMFL